MFSVLVRNVGSKNIFIDLDSLEVLLEDTKGLANSYKFGTPSLKVAGHLEPQLLMIRAGDTLPLSMHLDRATSTRTNYITRGALQFLAIEDDGCRYIYWLDGNGLYALLDKSSRNDGKILVGQELCKDYRARESTLESALPWARAPEELGPAPSVFETTPR